MLVGAKGGGMWEVAAHWEMVALHAGSQPGNLGVVIQSKRLSSIQSTGSID